MQIHSAILYAQWNLKTNDPEYLGHWQSHMIIMRNLLHGDLTNGI